MWAAADLFAGTVLGDYLGRVVWDSDVTAREAPGVSAHFHDMAFGPRTAVSPDPKSKGVHLLSHSCEPNCEVFRFKSRSLLVSTRKIFAGEELSWDYGISIAHGGGTPEKYKCLCGTLSCRGSMLTLPAYTEAWQKYWSDGEQEVVNEEAFVGQELEPLSSYPDAVPDHEIFQIYGSPAQPPLQLQAGDCITYSALRALMREQGRRLLMPASTVLVCGLWNGRVLCKDALP